MSGQMQCFDCKDMYHRNDIINYDWLQKDVVRCVFCSWRFEQSRVNDLQKLLTEAREVIAPFANLKKEMDKDYEEHGTSAFIDIDRNDPALISAVSFLAKIGNGDME